MGIEELLNNQWEIDKLLEEVKRLNNLHNYYLDYKRNPKSFNMTSCNSKKLRKIRSILGKILLISNIFSIILSCMHIISDIISFIIYIVSSGLYITFSGVIDSILVKSKIDDKDYNNIVKDGNEITYEKLCEKRSLYHKMNNEQTAKVAVLPNLEYQEYMQLLEEYYQVLDLIKKEWEEKWSNEEEIDETITTESPVRKLINEFYLANKSKM